MNALRNRMAWVAIALATTLVTTAFAQEPPKEPAQPEKPKVDDLLAAVKANPKLTTFTKLVESGKIAELLKGKGPMTVFVPTDEAFKKMGEELDDLQKPENAKKLERLLRNHIMKGKKTAAEIKELKTLKTLTGSSYDVAVEEDVVHIGTASVTKADVPASNGLIHIVDAVLKPGKEPEPDPS